MGPGESFRNSRPHYRPALKRAGQVTSVRGDVPGAGGGVVGDVVVDIDGRGRHGAAEVVGRGIGATAGVAEAGADAGHVAIELQ